MSYRARPEDGVAWVTGASAGIGRAVALELARRGYEVFATARRGEELAALGRESTGLKGSIVAAPGDVTDRAGLAALVAGVEARRPIALAVLNAGSSFSDRSDDYGGDGFQRTFALNVQGAANSVNPVFTAMRARRRGQIAIVGSLASYRGMPGPAAYGPSKAAVLALTEGLKFAADRHGVTVQAVNPGFVRTDLNSANTFPMPFLMETDEAARRICDGLERGGFEIRFPRRLAWPLRAITRLPYPLYFWLFSRRPAP